MPSKPETQTKRGRGRPPGAKNKATVALEKARAQLDRAKLGSKKQAMKEPKDILLESANYFWNRAQWLSDHARKLANEDATASSIDAIMDEAGKQLMLACKCAEQCAPYYHPRISNPILDGAAVSFVARLPAPVTGEEWAASVPSAGRQRQNGSH
jgi:hypothetical protein